MSGESKEMPLYQCHKQVRALQVKEVKLHKDGAVEVDVVEEGFAPVIVTAEWFGKHKPVSGGYLVRYGDGYLSFSPQTAFETGYNRI